MGKFDGILLCSDLDETLLKTDKSISKENKDAILYFMSEGGKFTFATGRVPHGAKLALKYLIPNAPMICYNGAAIYDFEKDRTIWEVFLDKQAAKVVEYIEDVMPQVGVEVCTDSGVYQCKPSRITREHLMIEKLPEKNIEHFEISEPWKKVIFMAEIADMPALRQLVKESEFAGKYTFIQSYKHYYEMLPRDAGKGEAMLRLANILGIDSKRTIGIGDNENDLTLVKLAGVGFSVLNAIDEVKRAADYITVDNDSHALAVVVDMLDKGKISKLMNAE